MFFILPQIFFFLYGCYFCHLSSRLTKPHYTTTLLFFLFFLSQLKLLFFFHIYFIIYFSLLFFHSLENDFRNCFSFILVVVIAFSLNYFFLFNFFLFKIFLICFFSLVFFIMCFCACEMKSNKMNELLHREWRKKIKLIV